MAGLDGVVRDAKTQESADVSDGNLHTLATNESEFEHVSENNSLAFSWTIVAADFSAAETLLLVQNISETLLLHIESIEAETDNASEIDIHCTDEAALTPAGGTLVTGECLNRAVQKNPTSFSIARSNETANVQGNIIWTAQLVAGTVYNKEFGGAVILAKGQSIAIDITTAPTSLAHCSISGYYKTT